MKKNALASMVFGAVMSAAMAVPALAQDAKPEEPKVDTHLEAAMAVVEQTGTLPSYEDQLKLITLNSKNWLIRQNPNAEKDISAAVDTAAAEFKDSRDQMVRAVARAWASYLKEDELKEVLAFFKTETGQKFASYQPRIIGESIGGVQEFSTILTQVIVQQAKAELEKKGLKFD